MSVFDHNIYIVYPRFFGLYLFFERNEVFRNG
jgi:hypothetical protein